MKNKKIVLVVIIILLCVFIPASAIGILTKKLNIYDENKNHELVYNGYLWFYKDNKLLSKYKCNTKICNLASSLIDDDVYGINYYKKENNLNNDYLVDNFAFISDGDKVYLYDVKSSITLQEYKSIKNYNTSINNNYYIVKNNDNKWGVIGIGGTLKLVLAFEYDFIGLVNNFDDNQKLISDVFIVCQDNMWFLISDDGEMISEKYSHPIVDFDNNYIFLKNNSFINIYNYDNFKILGLLEIIDYKILDEYYAIFTSDHLYIYKDLKEKYIKSYNIENMNYDLVNNNGTIEIYVNDSMIDSIKA